ALDAVNVLVNRVGGAGVPADAGPLLRRQDLYVFTQLRTQKPPPVVDVAVEAAGLELGQHQHLAQPAIEAVGQGEVDDPVEPAERDGRFRPVAGQRLQSSPFAAGQDQGENVFHGRSL